MLPAFMDLLKDADENGTYLLRVNEVDDDSPTTEVFDIEFNRPPEGSPLLLASVGQSGKLLIWEIGSDSEAQQLHLSITSEGADEAYWSRVHWHPTMPDIVAVSGGKCVKIFDLSRIDLSAGNEFSISSLSIDAFYEIEIGHLVHDLSFKGDTVAVASAGGSLSVFDWVNCAPLWHTEAAHEGDMMHGVWFLGDTTLLTGGLRCGSLKLWDAATHQCTGSLRFRSSDSPNESVAFYNHVTLDATNSIAIVANAKSKDFYAVHIDTDARAFDYVTRFIVVEPILSVRVVNTSANSIDVYCVQTGSIQKFTLPDGIASQTESAEAEVPASPALWPEVENTHQALEAAKKELLSQQRASKRDASEAEAAVSQLKISSSIAEKNQKLPSPKITGSASQQEKKQDPKASQNETPGKKQKEKGDGISPANTPAKATKAPRSAKKGAAKPKEAQKKKADTPKKIKKRAPMEESQAPTKPASAPGAPSSEGSATVNISLEGISKIVQSIVVRELSRERAKTEKAFVALENRLTKVITHVGNQLNQNMKKNDTVNSKTIADSLNNSVKTQFKDVVAPRLENAISAALSQVPSGGGGGGGGGVSASLVGELKGSIKMLSSVSQQMTKSIIATQQSINQDYISTVKQIIAQHGDNMLSEEDDHGSPHVASHTPKSQAMQKSELLALINNGQYEECLQTVLRLKDLGWLTWVLYQLDVDTVLDGDNTSSDAISQPVLISMLQQLGHSLDKQQADQEDPTEDLKLKLTWLRQGLLMLNPLDSEIEMHAPSVLASLLAAVKNIYPRYSKNATIKGEIMIVSHVINSLMRE